MPTKQNNHQEKISYAEERNTEKSAADLQYALF